METDVESLKYDRGTHFEFGKNWTAYSLTVTEDDIARSMREMRRMLGRESLHGLRFLDIGCGSGIHALAALRLGAAMVTAIDIDPHSVGAARALIGQHWAQANYLIREGNVFLLTPDDLGHFDLVYSWGVLHHTGDMWTAIRRAAGFVEPGGTLAIALYRKTPMCAFWRWEKRRYTRGGPFFRGAAIGVFVAARVLRDAVRLKNPMAKIRVHNEKRGMKWYTDVIDWLGGYPYESASPKEVAAFLEPIGFRPRATFKARRDLGLLGSGNAEYTFEKAGPPAAAALEASG
ncbi:MAG: class I SAM-dependent methyltransferase [Rhodospirillales bacterium]|nr:class I SAM-dependent methyltransferase [Rhodospirillales bacterium]